MYYTPLSLAQKRATLEHVTELTGGYSELANVDRIDESKVSIGKLLGTSGFGCVREIRSSQATQNHTVLKRINPSLPSTDLMGALKDIFVEAAILAKIKHPNIIALAGVSHHDPSHPSNVRSVFIVLERLTDTLRVRLDQWRAQQPLARSFNKRRRCESQIRIIRELASALS